MRHLKWKLSGGLAGTYPPETIAAAGGRLQPSCYVDAHGYRIGHLISDIDVTGLDVAWDVTELSEAEALTWARGFYPDAEVLADGSISTPPRADQL